MRTAGRWAGIATVALVLLTGCAGSSEQASSAASVGDTSIALDEISDQLRSINETLGQPADAAEKAMTNTIVSNNVIYELVEQAATQAGASVTQSEVSERMAAQVEFVGSAAVLEQQAAQAGVAPGMIETDVRVSLLARDLADLLTAGQEVPPDALEALVVAEVRRYGLQAGVVINPRFGVWDVETLRIVADPDAPSAPAGSAWITEVP